MRLNHRKQFPMSRAIAIALCVAGLSVSAEAAEQPLICFGNEPSWGVDLTEPGVARFSSPLKLSPRLV